MEDKFVKDITPQLQYLLATYDNEGNVLFGVTREYELVLDQRITPQEIAGIFVQSIAHHLEQAIEAEVQRRLKTGGK